MEQAMMAANDERAETCHVPCTQEALDLIRDYAGALQREPGSPRHVFMLGKLTDYIGTLEQENDALTQRIGDVEQEIATVMADNAGFMREDKRLRDDLETSEREAAKNWQLYWDLKNSRAADTARLDWLNDGRFPVMNDDGTELLAYSWGIDAQRYELREAIDDSMADPPHAAVPSSPS